MTTAILLGIVLGYFVLPWALRFATDQLRGD